MTLHKSLRTAGTLKRARNVLTRAERITILQDSGRWSEGTSVFGLPKVRQYVMKRRHAKAAKKEEGVEGAVLTGGAAPAEGAAAAARPFAGAKPAAGAKAAAPAKGAAAAKGAASKGAAPAKAAAPAKGAKGK